MEFDISDLQKVEKYIRGELNQNEIEALWVKFLRDPALYRYFDSISHQLPYNRCSGKVYNVSV